MHPHRLPLGPLLDPSTQRSKEGFFLFGFLVGNQRTWWIVDLLGTEQELYLGYPSLLAQDWKGFPGHWAWSLLVQTVRHSITHLNLSSFSFRLIRFLPLPSTCHPLLQKACSSLVNVLNLLADEIRTQILEVKTGHPAEKKQPSEAEKMRREKFAGTESAQKYWMQRNMPTKNGVRNRGKTSWVV